MAGIPNAQTARQQSITNLTVLREIHAIEEAVMTAIISGSVTATVSDGTIMTDIAGYDSSETVAEGYYNVWQGTTTDETMAAEMNTVIDYFRNLGYNIVRYQNTTTESTFKWTVNW